MSRRHMGAAGALAMVAVIAGSVAGCESVAGPAEKFPPLPHAMDDHLSDPQRAAYHEDAVRLALRRMAEVGSPALNDVDPPSALVDEFYEALMVVTRLDHPATDSIEGIHTFPSPETREILVRVDPAVAWTEAWRSGISETGDPAVDALMADYDLAVDRFYMWSIGDYAVIRAGAPLNAAALATRFLPIRGVLSAETNGVMGGGDDIIASPRDGGWQLDYSVGFGDCLAGCISRHTWSFVVDGAGAVEYLGSSGSPLP